MLVVEVHVVDRLLVHPYGLAVLAFAVCVIIVKESEYTVPRCRYDIALIITRLRIVVGPVDHARYVLLLFSLVAIWLLKLLHFGAVLYVDAVDPALLITDEQLAITFVEAHACDVTGCDVAEDTLQAAISRVPDFDALRVSCHKRIKDRIVHHAQTCLIVGQMIVRGLVVVVEEHPATTCDDALRGLSDRETVDLVGRAVESLDGREGTHIPDPEHS